MISKAAIYLTRNGLLEPLGQSQVLAYLRELSRRYRITLITFEKDEDRFDRTRFAAMQAECERLGIRWLPQRFRGWPSVIAPALSLLRMVWVAWRETRHQDARLIHARSYIPAAAAMFVGRVTGVPFIFDMRALWPEELITAKRLRRGSSVHRAIVTAERACLRRAAAVVSLTHTAVDHLRAEYPRELAGQEIAVIPTCTDVDRFTPTPRISRPRVHGCVGTVLSGWFRLDWLAAWIAAAARRDPEARFEIVTRDAAAEVRRAVDPEGRLAKRLLIYSRQPEEMPAIFRKHHASVLFYAGGQVSELGRSPTRMGEALAAGLPIVSNAGVGDVARIVADYRVGVLVDGPAPAQMEAALDDLEQLLAEPDLVTRCRMAAEEVFSLSAGVRAYADLYETVLAKRHRDGRQCAD